MQLWFENMQLKNVKELKITQNLLTYETKVAWPGKEDMLILSIKKFLSKNKKIKNKKLKNKKKDTLYKNLFMLLL